MALVAAGARAVVEAAATAAGEPVLIADVVREAMAPLVARFDRDAAERRLRAALARRS